MVARWDAFPLPDKAFYAKQKFVRCEVCEIQNHCVCLQLGVAEQATITVTGEFIYVRSVC
jgi:hypothetical protein